MNVLALSFIFIAFVPAAADSGSSDIEIVELFHTETPEELEAALSDGYPMPWLEEILNDESIPEEDRYWLDCRVRAVIAQDLHLFFDREGTPIHAEADWIRYGDSYWQESFIVNPLGDYPRDSVNSDTGLWGETGSVYDRYGEMTGELVLCEEWMLLSRDGSVGLLIHRGSEHVTEFGPGYLFLLYSDGSYYMIPEELWTYDYTLSPSGEYALLVERTEDNSNSISMYGSSGSCMWRTEAKGTVVSANLSISPDDRYCCVPSNSMNPIAHHLEVYDVSSGDLLTVFENLGVSSSFSEDGETLCVGSEYFVNLNDLKSPEPVHILDTDYRVFELAFTTGGETLAALLDPVCGDTHRFIVRTGSDTIIDLPALPAQNLDFSPHGYFLMADNVISTRSTMRSAQPLFVWLLT